MPYGQVTSTNVKKFEMTSENGQLWKTKTSAMAGQCSDYVLSGDPNGKELEHLSSLNSLLIEFLQCIAFPQNAQFALLETS
jgi:hypothetical protein